MGGFVGIFVGIVLFCFFVGVFACVCARVCMNASMLKRNTQIILITHLKFEPRSRGVQCFGDVCVRACICMLKRNTQN